MVKVGVIGMGMMGTTHLDVYGQLEDVEIVAVSDIIPERLSGEERVAGNVEGQAQGGVDLSRVKKYDEGMKLIRDKNVDLVDICLTTDKHRKYAAAVLRKGKHLMVEKPLARTGHQAAELVKLAAQSPGKATVGMCMRFWPSWAWLKKAIDEQRYGKCLSAHFRRVTNPVRVNPFYNDGPLCGGALLDLHIHDTDFVQYCFGVPERVFSRGYSYNTDEPDHVVTQYLYDGPDAPQLVVAEGGWAFADGYGFTMQFAANFERATVTFEYDGKDNLTLYEPNQPAQKIEVEDKMGYELEIKYFIDCIKNDRTPSIVTLDQAANSVKIVETEKRSIERGKAVLVKV